MTDQTPIIGQHIVRSFDDELNWLDNTIAEMGGLAEAQLAAAIDALVRRENAAAVLSGDSAGVYAGLLHDAENFDDSAVDHVLVGADFDGLDVGSSGLAADHDVDDGGGGALAVDRELTTGAEFNGELLLFLGDGRGIRFRELKIDGPIHERGRHDVEDQQE